MSSINKHLQFLLYLFLFPLIIHSCMDPIVESEDKIFEQTDNAFLNPTNDFPNGDFDYDLNHWGGFMNNSDSRIEIDVSDNSDYSNLEKENVAKLTALDGGSGLYNYFSYIPGDTFLFSFNYMIPDSIVNSENPPVFGLEIRTRTVDENLNITESVEDTYYNLFNEDTTKRLIADGNWHQIDIKRNFINPDAKAMYFRVGLFEFSLFFTGELASSRAVTFLDNFHIQNNANINTKPSDFNIVYPLDNDVFDLDTINNFQTIPFIWESSFDEDTILYTNRLLAQIPAENLLMSNGFEEYEEVQAINPANGSFVNYKMPDGFGTGIFNWFVGQSNGDQYFTSWVTDTISRSGEHSFRMGAAPVNKPKHTSTLMYTLSMVFTNGAINKDRVKPGTNLTIKGYMMTPSADKLTGDNSAALMVSTFTDEWYYHTSPAIGSDYTPDIWHPFEVSMRLPESSWAPNTVAAWLCFRYDQYADGTGSVYFDDVSISASEPIRYKVTNFFDITTNQTSSTMSGNYIQNLFNFINYDLSGLTFSSVDFEWSILATDLSSQVEALNSPVVFTVLDSSPSEFTTNLNSTDQNFSHLQSFIFNEIMSEE